MTGSQHSSGDRWPDDYVSLDAGRLRVRSDCVEGFERLGWTTLSAVLEAENVEVIRRLDARDNCRVQIPAAAGLVDGYLKRHRVRTLRRRMLEGSRFRGARSPGMAEAAAVRWCDEAAVPTMSVIAAGERLHGRGRSDSFFLSQTLTAHTAANEFWFSLSERSHPPQSRAACLSTRLAVLRAVATTGRRLHAAGLAHFDFYLQHFLVADIDPANAEYCCGNLPTACLIDLQRVEHRPPGRTRRTAVLKDLARFHGSMRQFRFTGQERDEWARWYFGDASGPRELTAVERSLLRAADRRWQRRALRRKWRKRRTQTARAA